MSLPVLKKDKSNRTWLKSAYILELSLKYAYYNFFYYCVIKMAYRVLCIRQTR